MTHDDTSAADVTTAGGEAAPAPVRRRRATRTVAAPTAAEAPAQEQPAETTPAEPLVVAEADAPTAPAPTAEPFEPPAAQAEASAPKARRSRRATRPAAAGASVAEVPTEAAAAPEAPAVEAPAADAPTEEPAEAVEEKPAKAPRRRRAASRAAGTAEQAVVETPAEPAAPQADEAPADLVEPEAEEETGEEQAEAGVGRAAASGLDVLAELAANAPATAASAAPAGEPSTGRTPPRLATTALLFQAPDPTARPRRRRAQVQAGSPEEISEATRHADEHADGPVAEGTPAELATDEANETETTAAPARASRRRGGRRRGAAAKDLAEATEDEAVEPVVGAGSEEPVEPTEEEDALDASTDGEGGDTDEQTDEQGAPRRRRRRGGRGRRGRSEGSADESAEDGDENGDDSDAEESDAGEEQDAGEDGGGSSRRRRRRRRGSRSEGSDGGGESRSRSRSAGDEVTALRGSTRLEAKRQRRREGRDAGRRRQIITEAEFLARREAVERSMIVRERDGRTQIAVLEDKVLVEHYVSIQAQSSMVGNVYLGRVQNVLPSMEAAFVDVGKGRNAVLYAGEVNWDAAGLEGGQARRIEQALKSGDSVLVQVTKDPIGHKGARLTSQVTLAGRYLVYVPGGGMTGISRKLPDTERARLKKILREVVPDSAGVIVRTAAEGASEEELRADIERLQAQWEAIEAKSKTASAPALLQGEPDMAIRVVRDIFNDDFSSLVVQGDEAWSTISGYVGELAPDLADRVSKWTGTGDVFAAHRIDEQLAKGMDRKVWLPSGGSLVIDRTEAMTVIDVNTGKFTGSGGTLEETVTRNNIEAAEEIVRQLRLRDIGGIIVIDFIDMVLESNRDLVLRRLVECLGRDRTKHQVAEVTSLGLVQMTRKRVGQGLVEAFSVTCEHCHGRGFIVQDEPVEKGQRAEAPAASAQPAGEGESKRSRRKRGATKEAAPAPHAGVPVLPEAREAVKATLATIAAAAAHAHEHEHEHDVLVAAPEVDGVADAVTPEVVVEIADVVDAPDAVDVPEVAEVGAPVLDVLAELAAAKAGRDEVAVAVEVVEPAAGAQDAEQEAEAAVEEHLELTPVSPDLFAVDEDDVAESEEPVPGEEAEATPTPEQGAQE